LTAEPSGEITALGGGPSLYTYTVSFAAASGVSAVQPPLDILLPGAGGERMISTDVSEIYVPLGTALVINRLSAAGEGDPKDASGLFVRMLYFSAITITTLGFGDITPVSSVARIIVGGEAVLGIVLMGLFLNSVAQKLGKNNESQPN
jgi:hypothetical protein